MKRLSERKSPSPGNVSRGFVNAHSYPGTLDSINHYPTKIKRLKKKKKQVKSLKQKVHRQRIINMKDNEKLETENICIKSSALDAWS